MKKKFLTWLDIERVFKLNTNNYTCLPHGIGAIHCFPDGTEIEYSGDRQVAIRWVERLFPEASTDGTISITLSIGKVDYNFEFSEAENFDRIAPIQYPLWQDQVYSDQKRAINVDVPENFKITAFHSFKGGVGRTTALMTYVAALLDTANEKPIKLLLIDSDLEAPGITLWLDKANKPDVSYIKFLEAMHYPPKDTESSISYFAAELRKTSFNVDGVNREIFVLPASLELTDVMDMQVLPQHLAKNPDNPTQLTDYLLLLGEALKVDNILIDLRAGLSELSSPILFDPRIEHFFVTTVAPQSIQGTAAVLNQIYQLQKRLNPTQNLLAKPSVILGPLTTQLKQLPDYTNALEILNSAYPLDSDELVSESLDIIEVDFEPGFMSIGSIKQALSLLHRSTLFSSAKEWAISKVNYIDSIVPENTPKGEIEPAKALYELCNTFQFAEQTTSQDMLVTDSLRNLAKHYSIDLPNAVSIGAKGAGKTFTYLQLCNSKTWENFLHQIDDRKISSNESYIRPFMWSTNLGQSSLQLTQEIRDISSISLSISQEFKVKSEIQASIKNIDTDWNERWEELIIKDLGYDPKNTKLDDVNRSLISSDKSVVLIIDGIEDIFDNPEDESQKSAIKALLQLPNKFSELTNRKIGLICFVRADYVQSAIKQNVAQYVSRFEPFRLVWTPETFLRLVYWICAKADIIDAKIDKADKLTMDELLDMLEKLWGKKLGKDNSKEAVTARWVFSALCDLNGRLQARDIVRFLKFAARNSSNSLSDFWKDRILTPEAIRRSLPECSEEKVSEAKQEIAVLQRWADSLSNMSSELLKSPFSADTFQIDSSLLKSLKDLGVIYEDTDQTGREDRFYLPEIYRTGLNFGSSAGGRPRVQALLKRNLKGMPF